MHANWQTLERIALIAACGWLFGSGTSVSAEESSLVLPPPAGYEQAPAESQIIRPVMLGDAGSGFPMAAPVQPCVSYRTHRSARRAFRCSGEMPVAVVAKNPADCCTYEVPLCIPCCCEGAPCVTSKCGLLGRGKVEYCWDCGFSATVVFKGCDIVVHYRG